MTDGLTPDEAMARFPVNQNRFSVLGWEADGVHISGVWDREFLVSVLSQAIAIREPGPIASQMGFVLRVAHCFSKNPLDSGRTILISGDSHD